MHRKLRLPPSRRVFRKPSSYISKPQWRAIASCLDLTTRQLNILQAVIDGLNAEEIGVRLGIAANTVHTHICRLHLKFDVHDRTSLVVRVFVAHLACEQEVHKMAELVS